jgi:hypothetical protein
MNRLVGHVGQKADRGDQFGDLFGGGLPVGVEAVHGKRFTDDAANGHARVQGPIGILVDHLHAAADVE